MLQPHDCRQRGEISDFWNLIVGQRRWNEVQGLKVRSRNSYLLNINPGFEQGDFQTSFLYLAALAGRPLASGVRTPQHKLLVWQLQFMKQARLGTVTDFNLLRIRSAFLPLRGCPIIPGS